MSPFGRDKDDSQSKEAKTRDREDKAAAKRVKEDSTSSIAFGLGKRSRIRTRRSSGPRWTPRARG